MQKWEVASLVFCALIVVLVASSDRLSDTVIELLDSLFIQFIVIFGIIGLAYVSPTVGIAASVSFALLFVFRNNSHIQKIGSSMSSAPSASSASSAPSVPTFSSPTVTSVVGVPPLSSYSPPSPIPSTEKYVDEKTVKAIHHNLTVEQEIPDGQYPLDEQRPVASSTLREFEYSPQEDTGTNEFYQVGASIDEKGLLPASIKPWLA
jgi:hypothetical protein